MAFFLFICESMSSNLNPFETMKILTNAAYPATYQTLYDAKPITCSVTGTTFDAVPAHCAAVLDVSQSTDMLPAFHDCSFYVFTFSSLPFLNCALLEQSANILCQ
jgi:hypothetical protein